MTAVFCHNAADRKAETWAKQLAPFDRLEFAVSDAAKGIAKAVAQVAQARRDDPSAPALEHGLDVFHTTMEAHRVLAQHWRRAEAAWEKAEAADAQGRRSRNGKGSTRGAWPRPPAPPGARRSRRSSRSSASKRPGVGPTPRWTCSAPTAGSTTAAAPRPRSPRR